MTSEKLNKIAELNSIDRLMNEKRNKNFPTPDYNIFTGELLGYRESDDHFRKRILKELKKFSPSN